MRIQEVSLKELHFLSEFSSKVYTENFAIHWINSDCSAYVKEQYSVKSLKQQIEAGSKYYLALKGSEYLGFMKLNFLVSVLDTKILATELEKIYFSLNTQRRGYGSMLLQEAIIIAKKIKSKKIILDVLSNNKNARNFYIKNGFKEIGDTVLPYELFKPKIRAMKVMLKEI